MKILIADDDPVSLLYLQDALQDWGYEVVTASDGRTACEALQQPGAPMLAILDWVMPGMDGIEVCRRIRETVKDRYIYLIMLTAKTETEFIVQALNAGADDFISKPFDMDELQVRVRAGRRISTLEQELRIKATRDALTGLYNRGAIINILEKEIARHERNEDPLSVIFCDLDHFKKVNDQYGHLAGDAVLREVANRIGGLLRPYDSLGRYGGEELMIVLPACDAAGTMEVAERIRAKIAAEPVNTDFGKIAVSLSLGVAALPGQATLSSAERMHTADTALYLAKDKGRNRIEFAASTSSADPVGLHGKRFAA
jgi:two-component system cell cycle response regulator